jgi:phosphatidylserine/phosphatidylglycerophosphate/cardiolipin synthase-like enzyme
MISYQWQWYVVNHGAVSKKKNAYSTFTNFKKPAPNHNCVHVPQNEAFLSALRNAEKNVFIQTPNLNAEPLIPAIIEAVKRGIDVYYYVCLGYNDAGELLPFQGGNNEVISHKLYQSLTESEKERLHIFNYVAKDQTKPIHNSKKQRSCHSMLFYPFYTSFY